MNIITTDIPGVAIIEPKLFADDRGIFTELYHTDRYNKSGFPARFVQDNFSRSALGVLRGLHIQNPEPQGKLVTVLSGRVLDVAVDVRIGSPTFGQHVKVELNDENRRQIWMPRGIAHGFVVLSDSADFFYKCDGFYSLEDELVVQWNDPALGIDWGTTAPKLSERDRAGRALSELTSRLPHY
jgi:dTDP-4-dehydrorhamnose 3,5-epimerase